MLLNDIFYSFEDEAIRKNISNVGCAPIRKILEEQYKNATVIKREFDNAGFYTYFEIPNHIERLKDDIKPFGDIQFDINDLEYGVGFVLFVKMVLLIFLNAIQMKEVCHRK